MQRGFLGSVLVVMVLPIPSCAASSRTERHPGLGVLCTELTLHAYAPPSANAWKERPSPRRDYIVQETLASFTRPAVEGATVFGMRIKAAQQDRERYQIPERRFLVTFKLSARGREQMDILRPVDTNTAYVADCGGHLFFAIPPRESLPEEFELFVDDSPQLAEQVARSLTDRVQFLRANRLLNENPFLNEHADEPGASNSGVPGDGEPPSIKWTPRPN